MATGDLVTLETMRLYLGRETVQRDEAILTACITAASQRFVGETGVAGVSASFTDYFDGDNGTIHVCSKGPLLTVTSVKVNADTITARATWDAVGYVIDGDAVRLDGYAYTRGIRNCEIAYTAGWATVPEDVKLCVCELATWVYQNKDRVGIFSRTTEGGGTFQYQVLTVPASAKSIMDRYRRVRVG